MQSSPNAMQARVKIWNFEIDIAVHFENIALSDGPFTSMLTVLFQCLYSFLCPKKDKVYLPSKNLVKVKKIKVTLFMEEGC